MASSSDYNLTIHRCTTCKDQGLDVVKDYPVLSFGDLKGKDILVVGINPSSAEYEGLRARARPDEEGDSRRRKRDKGIMNNSN